MLDPPECLRYHCAQCSHRTASALQLNHHVQRNHKNIYAAELFHAIVEPGQFRCICCDYKSYYQFELYEHCKQTHSPGTEDKENAEKNSSFSEEFAKYPCDHCRYRSDSSLCLVRHHDLSIKAAPTFPQDSAEETGVESRELNRADAKTSKNVGATKSNMSTRNFKIKKPHEFKCNQCSYRVTRKAGLKRHMLRHAASTEVIWFQCNVCSYQTKLKSNLKRHDMLQHATNTEIRRFKCNNCPYRAKEKSLLRRHTLRKHASDEEISWFQCNYCSYRGKEKGNLKTHMLQHAANEEISWFQCKHCSHRSKHKGHLKIHMLKHATSDEIIWFDCNNCSYRTKRKGDLKAHMSVKHSINKEIVWFQCNDCSYQTKKKRNLKRHLLKHETN